MTGASIQENSNKLLHDTESNLQLEVYTSQEERDVVKFYNKHITNINFRLEGITSMVMVG